VLQWRRPCSGCVAAVVTTGTGIANAGAGVTGLELMLMELLRKVTSSSAEHLELQAGCRCADGN
jgi:hypothetical protein